MRKLIRKHEMKINILVKEECTEEHCNKCKHSESFSELDHSRFCCIYGKILNRNIKFDNYALRRASLNGHLETVKFLVESGADIHNDYTRLPLCKRDQLPESKLLSVCNIDDKNCFYFIRNIITHKKKYCSYKCNNFFAITQYSKVCRLFRKEISNSFNKYNRLEECIQAEKDYLDFGEG